MDGSQFCCSQPLHVCAHLWWPCGAKPNEARVLPEFDIDVISVAVPYPGGSPEDVEQGIILSLKKLFVVLRNSRSIPVHRRVLGL